MSKNEEATVRTSTYADITRSNARYLAEQIGGFKRFGEKVGLAESQVSQLLGKNPTRNIGVRVGRRIEEAFDKPLGWIDQPHNEDGLSMLSASSLLDSVSTELRILKEQVAKASACLRAVDSASENDKNNLISLALSILEED